MPPQFLAGTLNGNLWIDALPADAHDIMAFTKIGG
jgi:hypothetical protein